MTLFYGLTGGIGSGKSTVASMFAKQGLPTLDLDQVGKDLINHNPEILNELTLSFGQEILNADHSLNRSVLAQHAFSSDENTAKLNLIMHKHIKEAEKKWRDQQTSPLAIIEASVLIESGDHKRMDKLIVVLSDQKIRQQRVLQRGNQDLTTFQKITKRQCTDEQRKHCADYVFTNNGTFKELEVSVIKLLNT
jgi:dephospho-CoA kinase